MKLAIIGSRGFTDYVEANRVFEGHYWYTDCQHQPQIIISGGAQGADALAKRLAAEYSIEYVQFSADWDAYGRGAGFMRNRDIIELADEVLAFWDGKSPGTGNSLSLAKQLKRPTYIHYFK